MYSHAHQADRLGAHILGASTSPNSSHGGTKIIFFFLRVDTEVFLLRYNFS